MIRMFNELACEDHNSFENYTRMPIAAIFWLLEKIRPAIERLYSFFFAAISSLFSCENWDQRLWILFFMQSIVYLFTFFI